MTIAKGTARRVILIAEVGKVSVVNQIISRVAHSDFLMMADEIFLYGGEIIQKVVFQCYEYGEERG